MYALWAFVIIAALLAAWMISTYNRLVVLRQNLREAWAAIDTELRRRYDLIPNLVETVKGYAGHEQSTLTAVIQARNQAISMQPTPESQGQAQNILSKALSRLIALSEAYPELKANQNFNELQRELTDTETRISQARRFYNANVREFNSTVQSFPTVLLAGAFNFREQAFFGIDNPEAFEPVKISFGNQGQGGTISLATPTKIENPEKVP